MTDSLLLKCAKSIYRADEAPKTGDWSSLPKTEQRRYEVMAAAALAVAYREPIYELDFEPPAQSAVNAG